MLQIKFTVKQYKLSSTTNKIKKKVIFLLFFYPIDVRGHNQNAWKLYDVRFNIFFIKSNIWFRFSYDN